MRFVSTFCFLLISTTIYADEPTDDGTMQLQIASDQSLVFRLISPSKYGIVYPGFYMLETEVTNAQFKAYLDATGRMKDDTEVLQIVRQRERGGVFSTVDVPYSISDATTIWRAGKYPDGLGDHPVALITLHDATDFAKWLTQSNAEAGLIRLPTWNEWMIAAYGNSRNYPWGMEWASQRAHTSHGTNYGGPNRPPTRTEPVMARPNGRTPEGIYGLIGNVAEYLLIDPTDRPWSDAACRCMGGGFTDGRTWLDPDDSLKPRTDNWGYNRPTLRADNLGFRVVLDPTKNTNLLKRRRIFDPGGYVVETGDVAVIPGLEVHVVAKKDDAGNFGYYARFTNRSDQSRFIVIPMDGSNHRMCMPHYDYTARNAQGQALKKVGRLCGLMGTFGLYADLKWPDDYIREVKPSGVWEEPIWPPFDLEGGKDYELTLTYTFAPSRFAREQLPVPSHVDVGTVKGSRSQIRAP